MPASDIHQNDRIGLERERVERLAAPPLTTSVTKPRMLS
jgi:hypothetical protein